MLVFANKNDKRMKYVGFVLPCSFIELKLEYQIKFGKWIPQSISSPVSVVTFYGCI